MSKHIQIALVSAIALTAVTPVLASELNKDDIMARAFQAKKAKETRHELIASAKHDVEEMNEVLSTLDSSKMISCPTDFENSTEELKVLSETYQKLLINVQAATLEEEQKSTPTPIITPEPVIEEIKIPVVTTPQPQIITEQREKDGNTFMVTFTLFPGEDNLFWTNPKDNQPVSVRTLKWLQKLSPDADYSQYTKTQLESAMATQGNINQDKTAAVIKNPKHAFKSFKKKF